MPDIKECTLYKWNHTLCKLIYFDKKLTGGCLEPRTEEGIQCKETQESWGHGGNFLYLACVGWKLKNQGNQWWPSVWVWKFKSQELWYPGREQVDVSAQGRANSPFLCVFVLFRPSVNGMMPPCIGGEHLFSLSLLIQMLISSRHILTSLHMHPETTFAQLCGHPLTQSNWHIKLTVMTTNQ